MATTVINIINTAYRLSRILPASGINPTAGQIGIALDLLKLITNTINIDGGEISFNTFYRTNAESGSSRVILPNFVKIYTLYFILGSIRLPIDVASIQHFYSQAVIVRDPSGNPDPDNSPAPGTTSIPYITFAERTDAGITLDLYFAPSESYNIEANGLVELNALGIDDVLEGRNESYHPLLLWLLIKHLRTYFGLEEDRAVMLEIANARRKLALIKPYKTQLKNSQVGGTSSGDSISKRGEAGPTAASMGWKP